MSNKRISISYFIKKSRNRKDREKQLESDLNHLEQNHAKSINQNDIIEKEKIKSELNEISIYILFSYVCLSVCPSSIDAKTC